MIDIGTERVSVSELFLVLQLGVVVADKAEVLEVGILLVQDLYNVVAGQLVGASDVVLAVGLVGTVEGTLFNGTSITVEPRLAPGTW